MNNTSVIETLKNGGIVIFPTDTAFGIGCRLDEVKAVEKIFEIRKRPEDKPLLALVSDLKMAEEYVYLNNEARSFVEKYWPGGVTVILPCKKDMVPGIVRANGDSLAIRIPKHQEMLNVIKEVGVPIVAPSANIAGEKTPYTFNEVNTAVLDQVDGVMEGECTYGKESTIVDATVAPWKIIREGAVDVSRALR